MKKFLLLLFLAVVIAACTPKPNYILSIDDDKMVKGKGKHGEFVTFPLSLTNNTNDTLKFFTMTCSWEDIYKTDNMNLSFPWHRCDSNFPTIEEVAPHKSFILNMVVLIDQNIKNNKFRLGMYLYKDYDKHFMEDRSPHKLNEANLLWSNQVSIPGEH